jgi:precorrin-6B methylase 2
LLLEFTTFKYFLTKINPMSLNKQYTTDEIEKYYSKNRITWHQFYESEKIIISKLELNESNTILDIGCGCGGLGLSLREKFGVLDYTGIEFNEQAAKTASEIYPEAKFYCGDILDISENELAGKYFNIVFSLGCVDSNVQFINSLASAWKHVAPGGHLVATFRLTNKAGVNDIANSYQYINFDGKMEGEILSYVVLNKDDLLNQLEKLNPAEINAFGYWGTPSLSAVTPFNKICFAAFSIKRKETDHNEKPILNLDLPADL